MSIQILSGKLKGEERKTLIGAVQKELQAAAIGAVRPLLTQFCEEARERETGTTERGGAANQRTRARK
jgi:hypothetical protein